MYTTLIWALTTIHDCGYWRPTSLCELITAMKTLISSFLVEDLFWRVRLKPQMKFHWGTLFRKLQFPPSFNCKVVNIFRVWLKWIFGFFPTKTYEQEATRSSTLWCVTSDKMLRCTLHLSINNYTWLWWLKLFDGRLIASKLITTMKTPVFSLLVEKLFLCVRQEPQMKLLGDCAESLSSSLNCRC